MSTVTTLTGRAFLAVLALGWAGGCSVKGDLGHSGETIDASGSPSADGTPSIDAGVPGSDSDARWTEHATYLGEGPGGVYDMAIDDTDIYWTIDGVASGEAGVWKVTKTGGTSQQLVSLPARIYGIALDATHVYFADYATGNAGSGAIRRVPKGGGLPEILVSGLTAPHQVAVDGTNVYWTSSPWYTGGVFVAPTAGGVETRIGGPLDGPLDLVVQDGWVYYTEGHAGRIGRIAIADGTTETLAEGFAATRWLAVDATRVYFDSCAEVACTNQALRSVTLAGTDPMLHHELAAWDGQVSVGGDYAFFARTGTDSPFEHGGIIVVNKTGGVPVLIGDEYDPSPFTIVADPDGQHVYWSDYTDGSIGVMDPFL